MANYAMKYGPEGTGYIVTPSFAIPNTGVLTVEAWVKNKLQSFLQTVIAENANSATIGFV